MLRLLVGLFHCMELTLLVIKVKDLHDATQGISVRLVSVNIAGTDEQRAGLTLQRVFFI